MHDTTEKDRVIETALVIEKVKLPVWIETDDGKVSEGVWQLFDLQVVRPDIAKVEGLKAPFISKNVRVKIMREDGKEDILDVGGWYVRSKPARRPTAKEKGKDDAK